MHRSVRSIVSHALGVVCLAGCVTINIYFPAAAAERAADRIIDEVFQLAPGDKPAAGKPPASKPAAPEK